MVNEKKEFVALYICRILCKSKTIDFYVIELKKLKEYILQNHLEHFFPQVADECCVSCYINFNSYKEYKEHKDNIKKFSVEIDKEKGIIYND